MTSLTRHPSRTHVETIFQALDDRSAAAQPIDAFFLIRFLRFQVLNAAIDDSGQIVNLRDFDGLLQSRTEYSSRDVRDHGRFILEQYEMSMSMGKQNLEKRR